MTLDSMSVPTGVKRAYTAGGLRPPAAPVTGMYGGRHELGQYPNGLAAYVRAVKSDGMPAY